MAKTASYSTTHELDRIEHIYNGAGEAIDYTYDELGMVNSLDRTGMSVLSPGVNNAVYDDANRIIEFNGIEIDYDGNGNPLFINGMTVATRNGMTLTWNQKGQRVHVSGSSLGEISYTYDAVGRRVSKAIGYHLTRYLYDGNNLIAELDGNNNDAVIAWYVYAGLDKPLARVDGDTGEVLYYHQDLLGSTIALTDEGGSVVTRYNYSPFGRTMTLGEDVPQPFRFTGREYDAETDFYYYRARYYSPQMKRFISQDPLRFGAGDVNWYAYVGGNPVNFTDPLGLEVWGDDGVDAPVTPNAGVCGSGWNKKVVPDIVGGHFTEPIDLTSACRAHDTCYGDCFSDKAKCDLLLKKLIMQKCNSMSGKSYESCKRIANLYYKAVVKEGDDAYEKAQEKCSCELQ